MQNSTKDQNRVNSYEALFRQNEDTREELRVVKTEMALFAREVDRNIKDNIDFKEKIEKKFDDFLINFDSKLSQLPCLNPNVADTKIPWYSRATRQQLNLQWALLVALIVAVIIEMIKK